MSLTWLHAFHLHAPTKVSMLESHVVTCVSLTRAHKSLYLLESLVASGVSITRPYDTLFDVQHSQKPRPSPVLSKIEERADF